MALLRLFVSSPQREFLEERQALAEHVSSDPVLRRYFEVFLFERQPAANTTPQKSYRDAVDECDLYIGLFGQTYGHAVGSLSPTEEEFDRATAGGKVRFVFVKDSESAQRDPRMAALIHKAKQSVVYTTFTDTHSLRAAVHEALANYLADKGVLLTGNFDEAVCARASLDDFAEEPVRVFLARAKKQIRRHLGDNPGIRAVLRHLGLGDEKHLTNAAVLLFGACPRKFFPSAVIKCVEFGGVRETSPIVETSFVEEPIFGAIERATDFVMRRLDTRIGFRTHGPSAPHYPEIPLAVISEAVVNAVAHRDYASRARVQIDVFRDRVRVSNPGRLVPPLTLSGLTESHASVPRNDLIAGALRQTRYMEEAGTGTLRMIADCRKAGLPTPKFMMTWGFSVELSRRQGWDMGIKGDRYRNIEDRGARWQEDTGDALGRVRRSVGGFPRGLKLEGV